MQPPEGPELPLQVNVKAGWLPPVDEGLERYPWWYNVYPCTPLKPVYLNIPLDIVLTTHNISNPSVLVDFLSECKGVFVRFVHSGNLDYYGSGPTRTYQVLVLPSKHAQ